jgi:hypothetical protein
MANHYLVGRVPDEPLASFDELAQDGELAQLAALAEDAVAAHWHGGVFEEWWRRAPKRGPTNALTGSDVYRNNDLFLLVMLQRAREWQAVVRRYGQPQTDASDVLCAWRWVRQCFLRDIGELQE